MALLLRRGTDAERQTIIPAQGELIYTTDTKELYVGDGSTQGGILVSAEVSDDTSPSLGGDLDLNGNNIIGTGNISITGNITATGNINLGDGVEDNVIVGGQISGSLIPKANELYDLGAPAGRWSNVHAFNGSFGGNVSVGNLLIDGDISKTDSTLIYDASSDSLTVSAITASAVIGDLQGSVFGDDSTIIIDSVNRLVAGDIDNTTTISKNIESSRLRLQGLDRDGERAGLTIITEGDAEDDYNLLQLEGHNEGEIGQSVVFSRSRGTTDSPAPLQAGDEMLGIYWFGADTNSASQASVVLQALVGDTVGAGSVSGQLLIATSDGAGSPSPAVLVDSNSNTEFFGPAKLASFANEAARDAAITSPAAGMMIFLAGHDDSSGFPKFQGYDGSAWVDLN